MPRTLSRLIIRASLATLVWAPPALWAQITPEQVVAIERVTAVAMSPDGDQIAYVLQKPRTAHEEFGRARNEIWIAPAAGGAARAVVGAPASATAPAWSADGSQLALEARFEDRDPKIQVYALPAAGGDARQLTHSREDVLAFAWSPDGKSIAYVAEVAEPAEREGGRARHELVLDHHSHDEGREGTERAASGSWSAPAAKPPFPQSRRATWSESPFRARPTAALLPT